MVCTVNLNPFSSLRDSQLLHEPRARLEKIQSLTSTVGQTKPMMCTMMWKDLKQILAKVTRSATLRPSDAGRSRNAFPNLLWAGWHCWRDQPVAYEGENILVSAFSVQVDGKDFLNSTGLFWSAPTGGRSTRPRAKVSNLKTRVSVPCIEAATLLPHIQNYGYLEMNKLRSRRLSYPVRQLRDIPYNSPGGT